MKLNHEFDRYIKLTVGRNGRSIVVRLTDEHNESRMFANIDDDPDGEILDKHNNADEKEEPIKTQPKPNEKVDLNDTERITSTKNVYYSL